MLYVYMYMLNSSPYFLNDFNRKNALFAIFYLPFLDLSMNFGLKKVM